jgi:undecaprenyl-phosphate 4-deoxy-4-formamido-L-arabinose transferase
MLKGGMEATAPKPSLQPEPAATRPEISVVIPVYNEAGSLPTLFDRLMTVLDRLARRFEVIFIDDGSTDGSREQLIELHRRRPRDVRVIVLRRNSGQHRATMAAFEYARGDIVVTLDADLQNPPEEIPKLLAAIDAGHDVAGGYRVDRQDSLFRTVPSRIVNRLRASAIGLEMRDHGCALRAYRAEIVRQIVASRERAIYVPVLAQYFAANPIEVEVQHAARTKGASKYGFYHLIRTNFDLMTGFTLLPLQLFTVFGMAVAAAALLLVLYLAARRIIVGSEGGGLFTLFAIAYFLIGIGLTGLGIVGEYVGRIYQEVRHRAPFQVQAVYEELED